MEGNRSRIKGQSFFSFEASFTKTSGARERTINADLANFLDKVYRAEKLLPKGLSMRSKHVFEVHFFENEKVSFHIFNFCCFFS